jgi:hypothetical protein
MTTTNRLILFIVKNHLTKLCGEEAKSVNVKAVGT